MRFSVGIEANRPFASWEEYREKCRRVIHPQMRVIGIEGCDTPKLIYQDTILQRRPPEEPAPILLPEQALEMLMNLPDMRLISNLIVLDHANPDEGWFRRTAPGARIPAEYHRPRGLILYRPAWVSDTRDTFFYEWSGILWDALARSAPVAYFGRVGLRERASWGAAALRRTVAMPRAENQAPGESIRRGRSPRELWASLGERLLHADERAKKFAEGNPMRASILGRALSQVLCSAPAELTVNYERQLALVRYINRTIRPRAIETLMAAHDETSNSIRTFLENTDAG